MYLCSVENFNTTTTLYDNAKKMTQKEFLIFLYIIHVSSCNV